MLRYLRLYAYFVRFSISRAMEFRIDFFFRVVMDSIYYIVNLTFFKILYIHTPLLGGWSESQIYVFVSGFLFVDAVNMTVFTNNMWWLPSFINKGDLDYYLVRPVSTQFFVTLREFAANSFLNLLIATGIVIWAISNSPIALTPLSFLYFVVLLLNGTLIFHWLQTLFILPVFWTHTSDGFRHMHWILGRFMEKPDRIYTGTVRIILVTAIPYALIASFPARLFLEPFQWNVFLHFFGINFLFFFIVQMVWRLGLKAYTSASS